MLKEFNMNQTANQRFQDYYDGKHKILTNYRMSESQSNEKVVINYIKTFTTRVTGYSLGQSVTYTSRTGINEMLNAIDYHFSMFEKEHNQNLSKQSEIFGVGYEINYINKSGDFRAMAVNPLNMYVIEDGTDERNVELAIHKYNKKFDKTDYYDVYVGNKILHYSGMKNNIQLVDETTHIFDSVPVNVCYSNFEGESGFADIISLNNVYNVAISDGVNELSDNRLALMKVEEANILEEDFIKFKSMGVVKVPKGADVSWLIKELPTEFLQMMLEKIEAKMYEIMQLTDFNEKVASNTSGAAIRNRLLNLSHRCAIKEGLFESTLKKRLANLFKFLTVKNNTTYDVKDVQIRFQRDLPFDIVSIADAISKLIPIVSQETLLSQLLFIPNVAVEMDKFRKEQEYLQQLEMKNRVSLDLLGNGGV